MSCCKTPWTPSHLRVDEKSSTWATQAAGPDCTVWWYCNTWELSKNYKKRRHGWVVCFSHGHVFTVPATRSTPMSSTPTRSTPMISTPWTSIYEEINSSFSLISKALLTLTLQHSVASEIHLCLLWWLLISWELISWEVELISCNLHLTHTLYIPHGVGPTVDGGEVSPCTAKGPWTQRIFLLLSIVVA